MGIHNIRNEPLFLQTKERRKNSAATYDRVLRRRQQARCYRRLPRWHLIPDEPHPRYRTENVSLEAPHFTKAHHLDIGLRAKMSKQVTILTGEVLVN
jgi:hypothetical protein